MAQITAREIQAMVSHWLHTPVNAYLGSDYGQDANSLLQIPFSNAAEADAFLQKLMTDVPVLRVLPAGSLNLYSVKTAPDKVEIVIEVAGQVLPVAEVKDKK